MVRSLDSVVDTRRAMKPAYGIKYCINGRLSHYILYRGRESIQPVSITAAVASKGCADVATGDQAIASRVIALDDAVPSRGKGPLGFRGTLLFACFRMPSGQCSLDACLRPDRRSLAA